MTMRAFYLATLVAMLAGCYQTMPISNSIAAQAPPEAVLDPVAATAREGAGRVIVTRDRGYVGMACKFRIHIDGKPAVALKQGQTFTLYAEPGERIIAVTSPCSGQVPETRQLLVNVEAGVTKKVRVGVTEAMDFLIEHSAL